ncbi:hypothetical protein ACQ86E_11940 [Bradyrhizobium betae]|uniref:hypothetical protein n=1 Tax=Bradyrhizobium betae TaxID=244734 RepID=UPI003D67294A
MLGRPLDDFLQISMLQITSDAYTNLLSGVAATGGVLIGLYYAATTAIAGAIYSRVPSSIRNLFSKDHVGNVYMRFLALLTYLSLVLLAFRAAGLPPVRTALLFLGLGAGVSVIGFVNLGARAFNLFDPTTLLNELLDRIHRSYMRCVAGHFRWSDASFQNHASTEAKRAIETIAALADMTSKETQLNGEAFLVFCRNLIGLLSDYQLCKKKIPTQSRWYPVRYIHTDWYRSTDSATSIAHQTAGKLDPKSVSDAEWIESSIFPIVYTCIQINFSAGREALVRNLLVYIDHYVQTLASDDEVAAAFRRVAELADQCSCSTFREAPKDTKEPLEQLALADAIASCQINMFLAYLQFIERNDSASIDQAISRIRWNEPTKIYQSGLPKYALIQLEWLYPRIEFERRSEGAKLSPDWYVSELVRRSAVEAMKPSLTALVYESQSLWKSWLSTATDKNLFWIKAALLSREAEYWQKLLHGFSKLQNRWNDLSSPRRIEGLSWKQIDFDELKQAVKERRKQVVREMATLGATLSATDRPDSYPDFAGQFLHGVGEELLSAFVENETEAVSALFPGIFYGALLQYERLSKKIEASDWRATNDAKIAVSPILDLMELSGYCILFSEFHRNAALSQKVAHLWTDYLDRKAAESHDILGFLGVILAITEAPFELAHRSLIRMSWKQKVSNALSALHGVDRETVYANRYAKVEHESPLVRVFAKAGMAPFYDGIDVFIEKLIRRRSDESKFKSPRRRDLHRAITREEDG